MSGRKSPTESSSDGAASFEWELQLPTDAHAVPEGRRAAIRACRAAGVSEEDCFALDLALGEALANAVTHGVPVAERAHTMYPVLLRLWSYHGHLIIEIRDTGPGFDPPSPPYPMPEDACATHGRGLPLMQRMTDALLVSRGDVSTGGASVYLIKELSSP